MTRPREAEKYVIFNSTENLYSRGEFLLWLYRQEYTHIGIT